MKLPYKTRSFKDYTESIQLTPSKPIIRNVLVGVGSFIIFSIVVLTGAITLGQYVFDPEILFGNPTPTGGFAGFGWFLFIYMLIPGIWEEVAYRGVLIPMLLKKYNIKISIVISSVIFGFAHSFNIITYLLIGLDPLTALFAVSIQIIYTTLLGLALGYMFTKTGSILPSIILHYLVDSVAQIFYNTIITNVFLEIIFLICFLGLIPAALIILILKVALNSKPKYHKLPEIQQRLE
jgi:membrane protease YdiL (CAAX protease family)